ncbi:hypothetical protein EIP91_002780 [Steccherinum ochraceum]|uniref:Aquaporin n=1 Tax=Steccherinum ochraceum TaxID=92696 RepID=A0A4R0RDA7_9APHY|nr:hypothetical protein EIP91_002780 [Steccherinum ochraceum]
MAVHPLPQRSFVHLADIVQRPALLSSWERLRHRQAHWFVECVAEFTAAFLYTYAGVGSQAGFVLGNIAKLPLSSIFQIGVAYGIGCMLALSVCAGTSGGHLSPAVTIAFTLFNGFPPLKAVRYIIAQILGAYVACLLVYVQYENLISEVTAGMISAGTYDSTFFTPNGPAGIFGFYVMPGSKLGQVFLNEFVCDVIFGIVVFTLIDPTNFMVSPVMVPWVVGLTYATMIWSYAPVGVACNTARDLGGRLAALTIWGRAADGGAYAAISALANIPGILCGGLFYEIFFKDSSRVVTPDNIDMITGHKAHEEHSQKRHGSASSASSSYDDDKVSPQELGMA